MDVQAEEFINSVKNALPNPKWVSVTDYMSVFQSELTRQNSLCRLVTCGRCSVMAWFLGLCALLA